MKKLFLILFASCIALQACQAAPSFDTSKYGSTEIDVTYCTPNDLPQRMDIYYPDEGGPWPVVVLVHGGSWIAGDKSEISDWEIIDWPILRDAGYLVISVNYRLAALGKFPAMIEDVKCAVRYLRAHSAEYNLDPDRIGAMGFSSGGHLAALLGTADESAGWDVGEYPDQSSQVQAVVSQFGVYDIEDFPKEAGVEIRFAFGALPGNQSPELIAASPVNHIDANDPPFLIMYGEFDTPPVRPQSETMQALLIEASVSSNLVMVENAVHGFAPKITTAGEELEISPTNEEIYQIVIDFLDANLK